MQPLNRAQIIVPVIMTFLFLSAIPIGCYAGRRQTIANFEKINRGMTKAQVEHLLGSPDNPQQPGKFTETERLYTWTVGDRRLFVTYDGWDSVTGTFFMDIPPSSTWETISEYPKRFWKWLGF